MMEVDDDFGEKSAAFTRWLQSSGAILSDKIEVADLRQRHAGRGVVAKVDIDVDEELFSIPRDLLLSAKNSGLATEHPDLLERADGEPWLELILAMLYENGTAGSKWRHYFDILPSDFDTLMYWDEAELQELEASAVVNKIGKVSADKLFREKIWPVIQDNAQVFGFASEVHEEEVLAAAHRMGSLIMAYAFDIESEREKEIDEEGYVSDEEDAEMPKAMVPLADILNADADRNNARLFYEPNALVMKAVKDIQKGEEIFNDYGPLPRSDLLRRYGYVTDNYAQYDVVEVSSELILQVGKEKLKLDKSSIQARTLLLEAFDEVVEEGYDISRPPPDSEADDAQDALDSMFSPSLKLLLTLLASSTSELPPTIKPSKVEKAVARNDFPALWYDLLHAVLQRRLAQYASNLETDKQHLQVYKQRLEGGKWLSNEQEAKRRYMALCVRVGEKEILQHALKVLKEKIDGFREIEQASVLKRKTSESRSGASTPKRTKR